jgi:hypothetical protein
MIRSGSFPKPGITLMTPKYSNAAAPANKARKAMPKYAGALEDFPSNRGIIIRSDISERFVSINFALYLSGVPASFVIWQSVAVIVGSHPMKMAFGERL